MDRKDVRDSEVRGEWNNSITRICKDQPHLGLEKLTETFANGKSVIETLKKNNSSLSWRNMHQRFQKWNQILVSRPASL